MAKIIKTALLICILGMGCGIPLALWLNSSRAQANHKHLFAVQEFTTPTPLDPQTADLLPTEIAAFCKQKLAASPWPATPAAAAPAADLQVTVQGSSLSPQKTSLLKAHLFTRRGWQRGTKGPTGIFVFSKLSPGKALLLVNTQEKCQLPAAYREVMLKGGATVATTINVEKLFPRSSK